MALPKVEEEILPPVIELNQEEWADFRDEQVQEVLGISSDEFLRRWQAGEYDAVADDSADIISLVVLFGGGGR